MLKTALAYVGAVALFAVVVYVLGYLGAKIEAAGERMPRRTWKPKHRRSPCRCAKPLRGRAP